MIFKDILRDKSAQVVDGNESVREEREREMPALIVRLFVRSIETAVLLKVQCLVDHEVFVW